MDLEMKTVVANEDLTPLEAKRLANWSMGLMWPCAGYGTTKTWAVWTFWHSSMGGSMFELLRWCGGFG